MISFVPVTSWISGVPPGSLLASADAELLEVRPVREFHVDQRTTLQIDAVPRAAFRKRLPIPATVRTSEAMMNGHFLPRKSKFVFLK